jgi:hypothetical protein
MAGYFIKVPATITITVHADDHASAHRRAEEWARENVDGIAIIPGAVDIDDDARVWPEVE